MSHKSESAQAKQTNGAFRDGHERMFGDAKPKRGRTVYPSDGTEPYEVSEEWENPAIARAQTTTEQIVHGSNVTQDGTDISTRKKRKEWMERTGTADFSDFKEHLPKKAKERAEFYTSGQNRKRVTEAVVNAYNKLRKP